MNTKAASTGLPVKDAFSQIQTIFSPEQKQAIIEKF